MKVLFFVDRLRVGGIQILLRNLFEIFEKDKIECELLTLDDGEHYDLEDTISSLGITIHKLTGIWLRRPTDYFGYFKAVKEFFKYHHDYDAIHINTGPKNYYILKCAMIYGIPVRIAHSHNTGFQTDSSAQVLLGNIMKFFLKRYATDYFACSSIAGKWLFGSRMVENGKVIIIPNGINLNKFKFNADIRNKIRSDLEISDKLVIGNVGRFTKQKNHNFMIKIFKEIHNNNKNSVLLLIGIG
ncbi:MAG: glycosyltransferase, partial [Candidatus Gastranaerophilales bacterium]|nr:glycosyltransferase [Candidatus Gastranaerophilales bacterium]